MSLIANIMVIMEGFSKADKLIRKHIHSNSSIRRDLVPMMAKITAFSGLLQAIKLEAELEKYDESRLKILAYVTCENPFHNKMQDTFYTMPCSPTSKIRFRSCRAGSFSNLPIFGKGSSDWPAFRTNASFDPVYWMVWPTTFGTLDRPIV